MKFKKIKIFIIFALFVLSAGMLSACGSKPNGSVTFTQAEVTMSVNQELSLKDYVDLKGLGWGDVTFVSSNGSIVYITSNYELIARSEGVVEITAKGVPDKKLIITVAGSGLSFEAPINVHYNEQDKTIVWNTVYVEDIVATRYNVIISKLSSDGAIEKETNKNVFGNSISAPEESGTYKVKVSCLDKNVEQVGVVSGSDYSEEYTFTKLSAPKELAYNDLMGVLTWEADSSVTSFRVLVNGVTSEIIQNKKEYVLNLEEPKKYEIAVISCANGEENVFGDTSLEEENLVLTRLSAPNISVQNGVLSWEDADKTAKYFDLNVKGATASSIRIQKNASNNYTYTLKDILAGEYEVCGQAFGDSEDLIYNANEHYLNSKRTQNISVVKLPKMQLEFDKLNKLIKVSDFNLQNNLKLMLSINKNGSISNIDLSDDGQEFFEFNESGEYVFSLTNSAKNANEINSDPSGIISVIKLGEAKGTTHRSVDGKYYVEGYSVANATKYVVEVNQIEGGANRNELTDSNNSLDALFGLAGTYGVTIYAYGTDDIASKIYYLESKTVSPLTVVRLKNCTITTENVDKENKLIYWENVLDSGYVRYNYELLGASEDSGELERNSYSYAGLGIGSYSLKVKAKYINTETNKIVLDSLNYATIQFKVEESISKPNISWEVSQNEGQAVYSIAIENVSNATHYEIFCNNSEQSLKTVSVSEGETTIVDVTSTINAEGEYNFTVKARNNTIEYYLTSEHSNGLSAIMLPSVNNIENDSDNNQITWDSVNGVDGLIYVYEIIDENISGQLTTTLYSYSNSDIGKHTLSVWTKAISNNPSLVYVDSKKATQEFEVYKQLETVNISWDTNTDSAVINILNVENATKYEIYYNDEKISTVNLMNGEKTTVNVDDYVDTASSHVFAIKAINDENKYYKDSEYSNSITAIRLSDPVLSDNENTQTISWAKVSTNSRVVYGYEITGPEQDGQFPNHSSGTFTTNSYAYKNNAIGKYKIKVWGTSDSTDSTTLILDSLNKSVIEFEVYKQLETANISWDTNTDSAVINILNVENVTKYEIYYNDEKISTVNLMNGEKTTVNVDDYVDTASSHVFAIKAINDENKYYKDSEYSNSITAIRLSDPALSNNEETQTISWEKLNLNYDVEYGFELSGPKVDGEYVDVSNGNFATNSYSYNKIAIGMYRLSVWGMSKLVNNSTLILESLNKSEIEFEVYKKLNSSNISWGVVENEGTKTNVIEITNVANATNYDVYRDDVFIGTTTALEGTKTTFDVTAFVGEVGNYVFKVISKNVGNKYYKNSEYSNSITAIRLSDPVLSDNENTQTISWAKVSTNSRVVYGYEITGPEQDGQFPNHSSGTFTTNSYTYKNNAIGKYKIKVWGTTNSTNTTTLILDSLNKVEITFSVYKTLDMPNLSWAIDETRNYQLKISNTTNADSYYLYCNDIFLTTITKSQETFTSYDVTSIVNPINLADKLDSYRFEVVAVSDNQYYVDSQRQTLTATRATAPETFNLNVSDSLVEVISVNAKNGWSTEILINNVAVDNNILDSNVDNFVIKLKYLVNSNKIGNSFYIDSDYVEFNIERIKTNLDVVGSVVSWNAVQQTTQQFNPRLTVSVLGKLNVVPSNILSAGNFDLKTIKEQIKAYNQASVEFRYVATSLTNAQTSGTYYATGNPNNIEVYKATYDNIGLTITENDNKVNVDWTKKENYSYKLNGTDATAFDSETFVSSEPKYFSIEEVYNTNRNVYLFIINRVQSVDSLQINSDETIINNGTLPAGANALVVTDGTSQISCLDSITTDGKELKAYYVANNSDGFEYYLNSFENVFKFIRLRKQDVISVNNNVISWEKEESYINNYDYRVIFTDSVENTADVEKIFTTENVLIDLNNDSLAEYLDILYNQLQGIKKLRVQKFVPNDFIAQGGQPQYYCLTAKDAEENNVVLKVLDVVSTLYIDGGADYGQNLVKVRWDYEVPSGYTVQDYNIIVYKDGQEILSTNVDGVLEVSIQSAEDLFASAGNWGACVRVIGKDDTISSDYSQTANITRLKTIDTVTISKDGVIEWSGVEGCNKYVLNYSYRKTDGSQFTKTIEIKDLNSDGIDDNLAQNNNAVIINGQKISYSGIRDLEINELFSGDINVTVYAVGTGMSKAGIETVNGSLSSTKTQKFSRVVAPQTTFTNMMIVIENFGDYTENETIQINASIGGESLRSYTISVPQEKGATYEWVYPTYYYANGEKVEFAESKDIVYEIYVTSSTENTVNSNVVTKTVTKLANLSNLNFIRENGVVKFNVSNSNSQNTSILSVNIANNEVLNQTSIEITDEILANLEDNWTIVCYAKGFVADEKIYIDGYKSEISGTKISNETTINADASHRNVVWTEMSDINGAKAVGYTLSYYNVNTPDAINSDSFAVIGKNMAEANAGTYLFNVRALGNVGESAVTENVILDSIPSAEKEIVKHASVQNIGVYHGYITVRNNNAPSYLTAVVYSNKSDLDSSRNALEYDLSRIDLPTKEEGNYYSNDQLMARLTSESELYIQFYVRAIEDNSITSDFSNIMGDDITYDDTFIIIRSVPLNGNSISLRHNVLENGETDYTTVFADFKINYNISCESTQETSTFAMMLLLNGGVIGDGINAITSSDDNQEDIRNGFTWKLDANGSWGPGEYRFKYAQFGSSNIGSDRVVYLTTFGAETIVNKLPSPYLYTNLASVGNGLYENRVYFEGAENVAEYYCYVGDSMFKYDSSIREVDLSKLTQGTYQGVGLRSISHSVNYLASSISYLMDEETIPAQKIAIKKLEHPINIEVINGALVLVPKLNFAPMPTVSLPYFLNENNMKEQFIAIKFTNKLTNESKEFFDYAYKYIYLTEEMINSSLASLPEEFRPTVKVAIMQALESLPDGYEGTINSASRNGFPTLNYNLLDFAKTLTYGEYDIQFKLIGDFEYDDNGTKTITITSSYSDSISYYISNKPNIRIENNNDVFNLKFDNVVVDNRYFEGTVPVYELVGTYTDKDGKVVRDILPIDVDDSGNGIYGISPTAINATEEIVINLTKLVEAGILTSEYTGLYVYVAGNNAKTLNGVWSNRIAIIVLNNVEAYVEHGIVKWTTQDYVSKYIISYGDQFKEIERDQNITIYEWSDTTGMTVDETYDVKIQAYGTKAVTASTDVVIISAPVTPIGKITKLSRIKDFDQNDGVASIVNGEFTWQNNENASGYDVFVSKNEIFSNNYGTFVTIRDYKYETTVEDNQTYCYYFRAVGTEESEILNNSSISFINSEISECNKAQRTSNISDFKFINGILTWKSDKDISFRLTFKRGSEEAIVINLDNTKATKGENGVYIFNTNDYNELVASGDYTVNIQSMYEGKVTVLDTSDEHYVISSKQTLNFHKFNSVQNITVTNGTVRWTYSGSSADHHFKLVFKYTDTRYGKLEIIEKLVASNAGNVYKEELTDKDISAFPIELEIYVVPGLIQNGNGEYTEANYAISYPTLKPNIYQCESIDETKLNIYITEDGLLCIDWSEGTNASKFEFAYYVKNSDELGSSWTTITWENSKITCGDKADLTFNIKAGGALVFKVRVMPVEDNYLHSIWTADSSVAQPGNVEGLTAHADNYSFTWNKYPVLAGLENSYVYKIKDQVGHYETIDGKQEFVRDAEYIYEASIGDERFVPDAIGVHNVSVAVAIKNSSSMSKDDIFMPQYCEPCVLNVDLFDGGNGTEENPYIISSAMQFKNIRYRLEKDTKNNSYYECSYKDGVLESIVLISASSNNQIYNFKQNGHLTLTQEYALANSIIDGEMTIDNYEFNGKYDGDYYSITFKLESKVEEAYASIFETIGEKGHVCNINLELELDSVTTINALKISVLVKENRGTINNIVVGKLKDNETITLTSLTHNLHFTFIAYDNYGKISNVQNYYNVEFKAKDSYQIDLQFGTIAINNYNEISKTKNYGNISISTDRAIIGGLVAYSTKTVSESANVGSINVVLGTNGTEQNPHSVGGIVGRVNGGTLNSCYVICEMSVKHLSENITLVNAYVGGLVGDITGGSIKNSYIIITPNSTLSLVVGQIKSPVDGAFGELYYVATEGCVPYNSTSVIASGFKTFTGSYPNALVTDALPFVIETEKLILKWELAFENNSWKVKTSQEQ